MKPADESQTPPEDNSSTVWWSTNESLAAGQLSILAVIETILAVLVYWTVAVLFNTTLPLLISICITPLLLLRSDKSVSLGLKWFHEYVDRGAMSLWEATNVTPLKSARFWGSVLLAAVIDGVT